MPITHIQITQITRATPPPLMQANWRWHGHLMKATWPWHGHLVQAAWPWHGHLMQALVRPLNAGRLALVRPFGAGHLELTRPLGAGFFKPSTLCQLQLKASIVYYMISINCNSRPAVPGTVHIDIGAWRDLP